MLSQGCLHLIGFKDRTSLCTEHPKLRPGGRAAIPESDSAGSLPMNRATTAAIDDRATGLVADDNVDLPGPGHLRSPEGASHNPSVIRCPARAERYGGCRGLAERPRS